MNQANKNIRYIWVFLCMGKIIIASESPLGFSTSSPSPSSASSSESSLRSSANSSPIVPHADNIDLNSGKIVGLDSLDSFSDGSNSASKEGSENNSPRVSDTAILLKTAKDGRKYMYNRIQNSWVEVYLGLMDGNWKELKNGNILSLEEASMLPSVSYEQGIRSPFNEFKKMNNKMHGWDERNKKWVEVDMYSMPVSVHEDKMKMESAPAEAHVSVKQNNNDQKNKLEKEIDISIVLKTAKDGKKYMYSNKRNGWVEAYLGLIDGNWKELENGKVLSLEEADTLPSILYKQGVRSPFDEFKKIDNKIYGWDGRNKEWVEVDIYSLPVPGGQRIR